MGEIIHRFNIQYGIPDSKLDEARPYIDMIQKGIEGLKPLARDIVGKDSGTVEITTQALYHACKHELGQPCEADENVATIDATKIGKAVEVIGEKT